MNLLKSGETRFAYSLYIGIHWIPQEDPEMPPIFTTHLWKRLGPGARLSGCSGFATLRSSGLGPVGPVRHCHRSALALLVYINGVPTGMIEYCLMLMEMFPEALEVSWSVEMAGYMTLCSMLFTSRSTDVKQQISDVSTWQALQICLLRCAFSDMYKDNIQFFLFTLFVQITERWGAATIACCCQTRYVLICYLYVFNHGGCVRRTAILNPRSNY